MLTVHVYLSIYPQYVQDKTSSGFDSRSDQAYYIKFQNLALNIRDCVSMCLLEETLKAVGPFYLVSMPGEVKYPTQGVTV